MLIERKSEFENMLEFLLRELDITETQFDKATSSYQAVGDVLAENKNLKPFKPTIKPQGSFLLGTMIKPIQEEDELDVDLVCQLTGKDARWAQYNLKQAIGDVLKSNETYARMLQDEGKRCWTLKYADDRRFHMDILPSLVGEGHQELVMEAFNSHNPPVISKLGIKITDNTLYPGYFTETNPEIWPSSNPFGYAAWFHDRCKIYLLENNSIRKMVEPFPEYSAEKTILQTVIQILKRHRDFNYGGDDNKPISIIITTLAAKAYNKETKLVDALVNVVSRLESFIDLRYDENEEKEIYWVENPTNSQENFADKWATNDSLSITFFEWLGRLKRDLSFLSKGNYPMIFESFDKLSPIFGNDTVNKAISAYGNHSREMRESGKLRMSDKTGAIGLIGRTPVRKHNNFGADA